MALENIVTEASPPPQSSDTMSVYINRITRGLGVLPVESGVTERVQEASLQAAAPYPELLADLSARSARTVKDILADPTERAKRGDAPFYSQVWPPCPDTPESYDVIRLNEYEALQDLSAKLAAAEALLDTRAITPGQRMARDLASMMRESLYFVGQDEMAHGTQAMAARLLRRVQEAPSSRFAILVAPHDSSSMVYSAVQGHLQQASPHAAARLWPVSMHDIATRPEVEAHIQDEGIIVMDDWLITGMQMAGTLRRLGRYMSYGQHKIQIDLVCAPQTLIDAGRVSIKPNITVPLHASYSFAGGLATFSDTSIALIGAHSSPVWGFATTIRTIFREARSVIPDHEFFPDPLLLHPISPYSREMESWLAGQHR